MAETFPTDSLISKFEVDVGEKELVPWDCSESNVEEYELDCNSSSGWDVDEMFKQNEQAHGVISNYDDELSCYTVPLKNDNWVNYDDVVAKASKIASEIENSRRGLSELDIEDNEENKYASVRRSPPDCADNKENNTGVVKIMKHSSNRVNQFSGATNNYGIKVLPRKQSLFPDGPVDNQLKSILMSLECFQNASNTFSNLEIKAKPAGCLAVGSELKAQVKSKLPAQSVGQKYCGNRLFEHIQEKQDKRNAGNCSPIGFSTPHVPYSKNIECDGGGFKYINSKLNPNAEPFFPRSVSSPLKCKTSFVKLPTLDSNTLYSQTNQQNNGVTTEFKNNVPANECTISNDSHFGKVLPSRNLFNNKSRETNPPIWNAQHHEYSVAQRSKLHRNSVPCTMPARIEGPTMPVKFHPRRFSVCAYPVFVQTLQSHKALYP